MEPKKIVPLYKWLIAAASFVLVSILTVFIIIMITNSAANGMGDKFMARSQNPSASEEPTKKIRNPDGEVRGIWIASVENIDFPSKTGLSADELRAELDDIVDTVSEAGINSIYFQVRPASDALYNSAYFPTSKYVTGTQGSGFPDNFDPLQYLIEIAHKAEIDVHAWVNPLRITSGTAENPQQDITALSTVNPARKNPDWVIAYDDGKLYYDAGIPEVRELIAAGVAEIAANYNVDGIVFDDYFYPYPVSGSVFKDDSSYEKYGGDFTVKADWRRDNVNKMVEACYNAIKKARQDCEFGIAPFGIWQNDNGSNGGSDTKGLNSYSEIYCNALAWIEGGYIDYIAPQIYWTFSNTSARFDVLVKWWNQQLDGIDDIDLIICHAMYRSAEWNITNEIKNQIEFVRSERSYAGSILYGYAALKRNDMDLLRQLQDVYYDDYVHTNNISNGSELVLSSPADGSYINYENTYVIGMSDPAYPLLVDGEKVSRTRDGYFSLYLSLAKGTNTFTFSHKGTETEYTIYRGTYGGSGETTYAEMSEYKITGTAPTTDYIVPAGTVIEVSVTAPSNSRVTAMLRNQEITLSPQIFPPDNADYMVEKYTGRFIVPDWAGEGEIAALGNITYKATRGDESASAAGVSVRIAGRNSFITVQVAKDDTELKVSESSWYYDDYTPQSQGMTDQALYLQNGYYKLRMGGYLAAENVTEIGQTSLGLASVGDVYMTADENETVIYIETGTNIPLNGYIENGEFVFTLYNVDVKTAADLPFVENPLFSSVRWETYSKENAYKYFCTLKNIENFYGYEFKYIDGFSTVSFKNPERLPASVTPLKGKTIIIDAGHGGTDTGASGPDNTYNEADMNLDMAFEAKKYLEKLGATVLMTRTENVTVDIYTRLDFLIDSKPDLVISIHQNSMAYNSDITRIRGLIGLYFADSGLLLTKSISKAVSNGLNRMERTPTQQRLAMVRNPKFPATLVEVGFITCVEEYDMMRRDGSITKVGKAIAQGVIDYYHAQEKYISE